MKIQLFHDDVIIGESSFQTGAKSSYEQYTLSINYASDPDKMKLVPNKLLVLFKSGTKEALSIEDDLKISIVELQIRLLMRHSVETNYSLTM